MQSGEYAGALSEASTSVRKRVNHVPAYVPELGS